MTEWSAKMLKKIIDAVLLPAEVTEFESRYLARMNRIGLWFFVLHLPVFVLVAFLNDTGPVSAVVLTGVVLVGPTLAYFTFDRPRAISVSYGITAMLMGGLLVHFGQGPVQIEMHFYFFALLAMLAMFGNPLVIVVAAVTVALHHLLLWLYLPASVFNYDAPLWVVAVHAAFVVLESVATCFIARSFFDNVIGLERIVRARTSELDARNDDMRLLLDNVQQGFLTIGRDGVLAAERSAQVTRWFGERTAETLADLVQDGAPAFAEDFRMAWEQVDEDLLPVECNLDLCPSELSIDDRTIEVSYRALGGEVDGAWSGVLVVMSDITSQRERERLEADQREVLHLLDRIMRDKQGFLEFFAEGERQVKLIASDEIESEVLLARVIHTLKGNSAVFGVHRIADRCHEMEEAMKEHDGRPPQALRDGLAAAWDRLRESLSIIVAKEDDTRIEVDDAEFRSVLGQLLADEPRDEIAREMLAWRLEPTRRRLDRLADQIERVATRLDKRGIEVELVDHDQRLDSERWSGFWSAFVHLIRNAVDHGIESIEERRALGKRGAGHIRIETVVEGDEFVIRLADDGRGIDWARVRDRAVERSLRSESREDLIAALFADGLSTRDEATATSGRGAGLAAIAQEVTALGGRVEVQSTMGQGTTFACRFPNETIARPERYLAA